MIIEKFQYGAYQVSIHKSPRAKRWAFRAALNGQYLDANWMSAVAASAYARQMIDWRNAQIGSLGSVRERGNTTQWVIRKAIGALREQYSLHGPSVFVYPMIRTWKRTPGQFHLGANAEIAWTDEP